MASQEQVLFPATAVSDPLTVPEDSTAARLLNRTLKLYPLVLLLAFFASNVIYSILTAKEEEELAVDTDARGPGGKPLPITKKKRKGNNDSDRNHWGPCLSPASRLVLRSISCVLLLAFCANGVAHFAHVIEVWPAQKRGEDVWRESDAMSVFLIGGTNLYLYFLLSLFEDNDSPSVVHFATWTLALIVETIICLCSFLVAEECTGDNTSTYNPMEVAAEVLSKWQVVDIAVSAVRLVMLFAVVAMYGILWIQQALAEREKREADNVEEATPLLHDSRTSYHIHIGNANSSGNANGLPTGHAIGNANGGAIGSANGHESHTREANGRSVRGRTTRNRSATLNGNGAAPGATGSFRDEQAAFYRPEKIPHMTWWEYLRGYKVFFPYLWPMDSLRLQILFGFCVVLLVAQRIVNIAVPLQVGRLTDSLSSGGSPPWLPLALFIIYKLLQGPSMLLGALRLILWVPISQYSYRALTTSAFEHVHSLSLDFHLGKRTGEVLSALNKGASINQFLEQITFQVGPMLLDLGLAVVFFYRIFDATYAVIVCCIAFWYLYLTVRMARTRADQRRAMTNADREEEAVKNDSITSYETVKYFNAEAWEFKRYRDAISVFQTAEAQVTWGINKMNVIQALVFMSGMAVVLVLGAYQVTSKQRTVGDFVTLIAYLEQLQSPLNFFSTFYRNIQQAMISGERLLELFKIKPTVVDAPGAKPLKECNGHIRWNNVAFHYSDRAPALENLDFECAPGTTTAFVGESGGGKSTIFRLMFRYYNSTKGSIEIDGNDVKDLTIDSVRRFIGVVPQDTTLFNETLMYNLRYANPAATDEEVHEACRTASIHDRIMSFPDGYNTKVGDRGLRLSGGERQRVAIARTILKNPRIIMLDEATSALDAHTEKEIQGKLGKIGEGRTLLLIAHRLSTITQADQIIVLSQGKIVEKGTHNELVQANGKYASMWAKQVEAERAVKVARIASKKAHKLMRKANIPGRRDADSQSDVDGYNSLASSTFLAEGGDGASTSASKCGTVSEDTSSSSRASSDTDSTNSDHHGH
ncbi:heavy metal tolerance protein [Sodiomyces alkalinus F11]|uniref:Heavy metal tolerance protein n=1 Tax=Sodiomyces alkalinus (strain CBS 110278 / VKM F-3762 / F11) TaxID=1314773 RepID=A0A3N2Q7R3_SODAK|nr:heavy metal tolerance protein [Sodiomyces alkalinus F11]ROT42819.1 heavy metal tolerance protein [Sodiomyces alkalinus F11]